MVKHLVTGNNSAGVGSHATHSGDEASLGAARDFVVGPCVADGVHQVIPLQLVRIRLIVRTSPAPGNIRVGEILTTESTATAGGVSRGGDDGRSAGTVGIAGELGVRAGHGSA